MCVCVLFVLCSVCVCAVCAERMCGATLFVSLLRIIRSKIKNQKSKQEAEVDSVDLHFPIRERCVALLGSPLSTGTEGSWAFVLSPVERMKRA